MERDPSWFPLMLWLVGFVVVLTRILSPADCSYGFGVTWA